MKKLLFAALVFFQSQPREFTFEQRIERYKNEYAWGNPDGPGGCIGGCVSKSFTEKQLQDYVLYRLKLEQFEKPCISK